MNKLPNDEIPYSEFELLRRAITTPGLPSPESATPWWIMVRELFQCEEAVAKALCCRYQIDPESRWFGIPSYMGPLNPYWDYLNRDLDDGK